MPKQSRILLDMKKRSQAKSQSRFNSYLQGFGYLVGNHPSRLEFPEIKPPEMMVREAWENVGRYMFEAMDKTAEEHHLSPQ